MSKQANKTVIGAFVVGAIALVVVGLLIFGSGKFLSKRLTYVMFFEGSVKGLQVGSPVTFRGVKIGEVTDIGLRFNPADMSVRIPVYVEINPDKFMSPAARKEAKPYQYYQGLIEKGVKARLELQSFVTGQLLVGLDFYPDKPIRLVGLDKKYREIPTIPSGMEQLAKTIQDLPLKEITERLNSVLEGANTFVRSPELSESVASLNRTLKDLGVLAKNMDGRLEVLTASLMNTSESARSSLAQAEKTLAQAEKTLALNEGVPGEIASSLKATLTSSGQMMDEAKKAMEGVKLIAAQNANLGYEINRSVEQMTALSRSLRSLADYLDRHPESLIKGKSSSKGG